MEEDFDPLINPDPDGVVEEEKIINTEETVKTEPEEEKNDIPVEEKEEKKEAVEDIENLEYDDGFGKKEAPLLTEAHEEVPLDETLHDESFRFEVKEPEQHKKGNFWLYTIVIETNLKEYDKQKYSVKRRYSDFEWVRGHLVENFPGCLVPPIPEKSILGSLEKLFPKISTESMHDYRRRSLAKFLTRVGEHESLRKSHNFKLFLTQEFFSFQKVKQSNKVKKVQNTFFKKKLTRIPDWITDAKKFAENLEEAYKKLRQRFHDLVKKRTFYAKFLNEFGKGFRAVGNVEKKAEEGPLAHCFLELGNKTEEFSSLYEKSQEKEMISVIETVSYYIGVCNSIKQVVKNLISLRLIRDDITASVQSKTAKLNSLKQKKPTTDPKVSKLMSELTNLKEQHSDGNKLLEEGEKMFKKDVEKFDIERKVDMSYMLMTFSKLQQEFMKENKRHWRSFEKDIQDITKTQDIE